MDNLINSYAEWIKKETSFRDLGDGWHEILTPFLNHNNDMIEVYVQINNDKILLSDEGNTINELALSGVDLSNKSKKRVAEMNVILRSLGVENVGNKLMIKTDIAHFAQDKHRFIQAVMSVGDMFMTASSKVEGFFIEDIMNFFDMNEIPYVTDSLLTGKSGLIHKFDFTLPKNKKERHTVIKAVNSPRKDLVGGMIFMIEDIKKARRDMDGLLIINDNNAAIPSDITKALNEYEMPYFPWSGREAYLPKIRA